MKYYIADLRLDTYHLQLRVPNVIVMEVPIAEREIAGQGATCLRSVIICVRTANTSLALPNPFHGQAKAATTRGASGV